MKYVKELEGLRGIMALWVVIGHWSTTADIPTAIGQTKLYNGYAVDVFIILSGFAITAMLLKRSDPYPDYLGKRFFRIFPIYLFYLGLSILLAGVALDTWQMAAGEGYMNARRVDIAQNSIDNALPHSLAHLVALHGVVPADWLPDTDFAFLGQAWSISLEWQFYLVAPLLIGALMLPLRGLSGL
ncbi:acyltransferase family protein, partial [Poseidonocella sedimentorum]